MEKTVTVQDLAEELVTTSTGCMARSHPAESQERGTENSAHPQSRHTVMSGDGVKGG